MAGTTWDVGLYTVIEAEALTLKEVVQRTIQMQMNHIIFERDSEMVMHAIHANYGGNSKFSVIIYNIIIFVDLHPTLRRSLLSVKRIRLPIC